MLPLKTVVVPPQERLGINTNLPVFDRVLMVLCVPGGTIGSWMLDGVNMPMLLQNAIPILLVTKPFWMERLVPEMAPIQTKPLPFLNAGQSIGVLFGMNQTHVVFTVALEKLQPRREIVGRDGQRFSPYLVEHRLRVGKEHHISVHIIDVIHRPVPENKQRPAGRAGPVVLPQTPGWLHSPQRVVLEAGHGDDADIRQVKPD